MTRALILYAHPCPESFNAAVHKMVVETLTQRGWDVDDCDLNMEEFSPTLTLQERRDYHLEPQNTEPVKSYVDRLQSADVLVLVFPVWNYGFPAILKGFLDRVFLPGVSFKLENGGISPGLKNIKTLAACCTYGGSRFRSMLNGDPPRKCVMRAVWYACGMPKKRYVALYDMNNNKEQQLLSHLQRVKQEMELL